MNKQELEKWIDEHKDSESMQNGYFIYVDDLRELLKNHTITPKPKSSDETYTHTHPLTGLKYRFINGYWRFQVGYYFLNGSRKIISKNHQ